MKNLAAEFQAVSALYSETGEVLARVLKFDNPRDSKPLVESVLQNRNCLDRIEQMNSRVLQLADEWRKRHADKDTEPWDEINRLAENTLQQAIQLNQLCTLTGQKLQSARDKLVAELAEMGKGARYLKIAKSPKNNYPKFIDSMY
jgi:hypothetical protein